MLPILKDLSDSLLIDSVKSLKLVENETVADLVLHLSEIDSRKLYRDIGYSSLFIYCTEGLGYSEGSAYRRIQAARSLKENPEIYGLLRSGKLSLCSVAEISKVIKPENKAEILELSQGMPKTEVLKLTAKYLPATAPLKKEKIIPKKVVVEQSPIFSTTEDLDARSETVEETRFTFTVEVDSEFMDLLKEAKDMVGVVPSIEVLKRTLKEFVGKRKATPRAIKVFNAKPATTTPSRYIPKSVAFAVRQRDQHKCSYISPDGKKCNECCGLQIDHIQPFALVEVMRLQILGYYVQHITSFVRRTSLVEQKWKVIATVEVEFEII